MPTENTDLINPSQAEDAQKPSPLAQTETGAVHVPPPTTPPPWTPLEDPDKLDAVLSRIDNVTQYQDLITIETDIDSFIQKFDPNSASFLENKVPLITQIDEEIKIDCLRETQAGALYSVHKVKQGGLLYVFYKLEEFSNTGRYVDIKNWYYVKVELSYQDFSLVKIGMRIEDVAEIDPATSIFIDRADKLENPVGTRSFHYLSDGILYIAYLYENGRFEVSWMDFQPDFQINTYCYAREYEYIGCIFPMDYPD